MSNWVNKTWERGNVFNLNRFSAQEILNIYTQTHKLSCENSLYATIWTNDRFFTHCPLGGALPLVSSAPPTWADCSCAAAGEPPHPGMKNWDKTGTLRQMHTHKDVTCRRTRSNKSCLRLHLTVIFKVAWSVKCQTMITNCWLVYSRIPRWCQVSCFARTQKLQKLFTFKKLDSVNFDACFSISLNESNIKIVVDSFNSGQFIN